MPTSSMSGVRMHFWTLVAVVVRRRALPEEERHELHHARVDEQQVGVVEDHRGTRHLGVARLHEMIEEPLPDLVCLHVVTFPGVLFDDFDRPTVPVGVGLRQLHEAQPHRTARVVHVEVDQHDALPGAEQGPARLHRNRHRRGHDRRQHVVGAVAERTVGVPVAVVARQQPLQRVDQVVVGARPGLDDRDTGRRVRDEHVAQPVSRDAQKACAPRRSGRRGDGGWCRRRARRCPRNPGYFRREVQARNVGGVTVIHAHVYLGRSPGI